MKKLKLQFLIIYAKFHFYDFKFFKRGSFFFDVIFFCYLTRHTPPPPQWYGVHQCTPPYTTLYIQSDFHGGPARASNALFVTTLFWENPGKLPPPPRCAQHPIF
jgi:hypothetical protein